jgi:glyoxylase-like metal-dependent hydrolase (beta-lactamase superfamily II)
MTQPAIPGYLHCISIPTPFPVGPVNVYLAEGEQLTLIDTGPRYDPARQALRDAMIERGYRVADLQRILLTHVHADHCGLAAELARASGAEVWTHATNLSRLAEDGAMIHEVRRDLQRLISYARMMRWCGVPSSLMMKLARTRRGMGQYTEPLTPDCALHDGDVVQLGSDDWHVLHTPGHTGGLICLLQPRRRLLLSSDHLLRDISFNPVVDPPAPGEREPTRRLVQYLEQLQRVTELGGALAGSHGRSTIGRLAAVGLALFCVVLATVPAEGRHRSSIMCVDLPPERKRPPTTVTLSLDGVTLELMTSFLSDLRFVTSDPDSAIQMATAVERAPCFRAFSITAVPYGASPPTESLPAAGPGREQAYRAALRAYREAQHGDPQVGVVMRLFGEDVIGSTSVVSLPVHGDERVPVAIAEWVIEAGGRLWVVRASREMERSALSRPSAVSPDLSFPYSVLSSHDLTRPSTSLAAARQYGPPSDAFDVTAEALDLPSPAWWDGECNTVNFHAVTGAPAYPLGAEYRGVKACGPRPVADGGPWRWVSFGVGSPQIEWECPELSKRFLYLAYGIPPYLGNGNQVVENYDGDLLEKVWNCTVGRAPQPDDVLSYGATTTYGHTSVVVASDVNASGDGTISVIEQNSSPNGYSTLYVNDWCVASYTDVIGWLHHPDWSVEYFGDENLADRCASEARTGLYLFEAWGYDAPADGCPHDRFGARFSRSVDFPGGNYTFGLGYDEGARLQIDGETVVDGWSTSEQHYQTHHLGAGHHQVSVAYYDHFGDAALTAFWWGPGFELARESRCSSRWYAEYWGNQTLWWDPIVKVNGGDGPLDQRWFGEAPAVGLPADHFSSRFRRTVSFDAGRWRFDLFADDGVRLWIDDLLVVDEWQDQVAVFTPTVSLAAGDHDLKIEHYENLGHAKIGLDWKHVSSAITPTGWVTSPLDGTLIRTCPMTIEAQVGDGIGAVDRVELYALYDDRWHHLGDDDASPYSWVWDCLFVDNQTIWLTVHVWDAAGNEFVDLGRRVVVTLDHRDPETFHLPLILKLGARES